MTKKEWMKIIESTSEGIRRDANYYLENKGMARDYAAGMATGRACLFDSICTMCDLPESFNKQKVEIEDLFSLIVNGKVK